MSCEANVQNCCVGIIANPVSARDIRRIVTNASNLQTSERVSIVLRLLSTLRTLGVPRVLMMPDNSGLAGMLIRAMGRQQSAECRFPAVEFIDMPVTSTVTDTFLAARAMQTRGVRAIIVLGGDGTHRAVVRELHDGVRRGLPKIPIAGISTGTNNAFPEMREPTVTALAVGAYAVGRLNDRQALRRNKLLEVQISTERRDIAIVDAVVATERFVGAKALWQPQSIKVAYLTFAEPWAIGLSAIGGLLHPVGRTDAGGLMVYLGQNEQECRVHLQAPIAPGLVSVFGIARWATMTRDINYPVAADAGVIALDGEREMIFDREDEVQVTLREGAFLTVDVERVMSTAARHGLFVH